MAVYAIVLAGGAGTRFWPASRSSRPKQLLPLASGKETLLAATVRRIAPLVPPSNVVVSTGVHLMEATRAALSDAMGVTFLAEPVPRNTAPCIAWAAATLYARNPQAVCMVLPSDHFIAAEDAYIATVARALDAARNGHLTMIGIKPTRPETGFGYIEIGSPVDSTDEAFAVQRFVEKPTRERAEEYLASGRFLWNAGMFFFQARTMVEAVRAHLPEVARGIDAIVSGESTVEEVFPTMPGISIDHGVMEKAANVAVVPGDFGWSDLGTWESIWELLPKDGDGNVLPGESIAIDAHRNLVWDRGASPRTYAIVGVNDLVVVETGDAVLIVPRSRSQDVRLVVEQLRATGKRT
jgi:mannose-1-phosphate guanylyltransferase